MSEHRVDSRLRCLCQQLAVCSTEEDAAFGAPHVCGFADDDAVIARGSCMRADGRGGSDGRLRQLLAGVPLYLCD
jgi:hypothetical protein